MRSRLACAAAILLALSCGASSRRPLPAGACTALTNGSRPWEERGARLPVPPMAAPRRGAAHPRVVIQEFSDFQCPYCKRAVPTVDRLLADYGACVQVVWRNRPMRYHEFAELAARAALEVQQQRGDAAFWRYHDRIFAAQARLSRAQLEADAEAIGGIDMNAFRAALESDEHRDVIERDERDADRIDPGYGTPLFFVNGNPIEGALPYDVFASEVEDALRALLPR